MLNRTLEVADRGRKGGSGKVGAKLSHKMIALLVLVRFVGCAAYAKSADEAGVLATTTINRVAQHNGGGNNG